MDVLELIVSWPGVFLILGLLIFIAFMIHPKFFENFKFIFKRKDKEIQIESKSVEHKAAEEKVGTEPSASLQKKKIKTEEKEELEQEIEEGAQEIMDKALDAYEKKDIEEFTKFWDIAIEKLDEPLKSNFLALRFFHRYHLGDKDAIEELNKLIDEENKSSKFAREYLAKIYQRLDKTKDAIDLINKNIEASNDVKDTLKYSFKLCDLKIESKAYKETEEILKILRDKYHDSLSVSKIMKKFGELYEEMEKLEIALCYFEKALELDPANDSLRFNIAYKYGKNNQEEMSVFHYKILDNHNYNPKTIKNNLGVAYENLGIPIKGIKYYQNAHNKGYTLASSNIGYQYINAGFIDPAKEILNKALENKHVHRRVNEALASIEEKISNENKLEEKILKLAKTKKEFSLKACASFVYKVHISYEKLVGEWNSTLSDINFIKEEKIRGQFKNKYDDLKLEEEGLNDSVFRFNWERGIYYPKLGNGILVFSEDGNEFEGLLIDFPDKYEFITFSGNKK